MILRALRLFQSDVYVTASSRNSLWCAFCQPHLPKVLRTPERFNFLRLLCEIELSLQSGAHFLDLIFRTLYFLRFLCDMELPLQSGAHLPASSSKSAPSMPSVYNV